MNKNNKDDIENNCVLNLQQTAIKLSQKTVSAAIIDEKDFRVLLNLIKYH